MYTPCLQIFARDFAPLLQGFDHFAAADGLARFFRAEFPCEDAPIGEYTRELRLASCFVHTLLEYGSTMRLVYAAFPEVNETPCPRPRCLFECGQNALFVYCDVHPFLKACVCSFCA
jgi:hypothetical protein